jgi:alkyl sulfatase BDS1-like metallo-beta-lactamase superfamily hydrolase
MPPEGSITPEVHPDLARHQGQMVPKIYTVKDHIHLAFGYSVSSCTMIEGDDGLILVDTLNTMETAEPVAAAFREMSDKPIKAIIYTHFHADHVSGVKAFVSDEDLAAGNVDIIAQEELTDHVMRDVGVIAPILGRRAMYQFGIRLPVGDDGNVGAGLGPPNRPGTRTFVQPTITFKDFIEVTYCGVRIQVHLVPSETEDQCAVWLPDEKVLISADAVYESFPNVYAVRGTRFRNPLIWAQGIDRLREFKADVLLPHHCRPVEGAAEVDSVLTAYRDAIQYMHDQTIRWMNKGYSPDEIKDMVVMPDHLKDHDFLGEYYGSYKHSVPAVYAGYLGWYHGDPTELDPLPFQERAARHVDAMGGRDRVLEMAQAAFDDGDDRWAMDLLTWLIRRDNDDTEARALKAQTCRRWGYQQKNATWRNWGLTAALELEGQLQMAQGGMVLGSPEQVQNFPFGGIMETMTVRLIAEDAMDFNGTVAFETTDSGESCAMEVRRGICQFYKTAPGHTQATVRFDRKFLLQWLFGRTTFEEGVENNAVSIDGDTNLVGEFLAKFEPFNQAGDIPVAVR